MTAGDYIAGYESGKRDRAMYNAPYYQSGPKNVGIIRTSGSRPVLPEFHEYARGYVDGYKGRRKAVLP